MSSLPLQPIRDYLDRRGSTEWLGVVGSVSAGGCLALTIQDMVRGNVWGPTPLPVRGLMILALGFAIWYYLAVRRARVALRKETGFSTLIDLIEAEGGLV